MAKPVSISVKEISAAARGTVAKALDQHKAAFPKPDYRLGYIPPYWWFGIVIYNPLNDNLTLGNAQKLATDVHSGIAASVSSARALSTSLSSMHCSSPLPATRKGAWREGVKSALILGEMEIALEMASPV